MEFMEKGFPNMMGKGDPSNPFLNVLGGFDMCDGDGTTLPSACCDAKSNSPFGVLESGLSFSSPFIASNVPISSVVDLKLGKFADWSEAKSSRFVNETSGFSSVGSSFASKRARTMNLSSENLTCQVHGCNKDLSSSKDYHKRHRVCDVHSKTARVIVNGVEKRFCQQCSRFHLLAEFDDGKRSCRKRLAGHNERRRKPQLDTTLSGKPHMLVQYLEDDGFLWASLPKRSSFVFPDVLPSGFIPPQGNVRGNQFGHAKVEKESNSNLIFHPYGSRKQFSPGNFSSQTGYTFETASTVQELSGLSNSGSALSLLSKNLSSHLTEIPSVMDQNAGNYDGLSIEKSLPPNGFCSSVMDSMEIGQVGSPVFFNGSSRSAVDFRVQATGNFQRSNNAKGNGYISPEHERTVDLVQLSSHLQRVEQQRNSMQLQPEHDVFCYFPTM
ncbi:hypothetical protein RHSIM_Rhsim12G0073700 [Rhododendron simsii]|uniref:SBP-type domain-containing protein n=1 Tax=Rhododendron simsii TaxID=118357 RepID=A0A834L6H8_RHOSS|nr:hypothetical protein RHSIM_Rhsim12G0073700 [Rhododendron simsii]